MSRVGKLPVKLPGGVSVSVDNRTVTAIGPKGTLELPVLSGINIETSADSVSFNRRSDAPEIRARHGLMRSLVENMVMGVSEGFERKLELNGVGYRVALQGQELRFNLGFSHEVVYKLPEGIEAAIEQNVITIRGIDKQSVGQVAAEIRALRKPEPYKGKGIKYLDEKLIRKSGKSGKEAG